MLRNTGTYLLVSIIIVSHCHFSSLKLDLPNLVGQGTRLLLKRSTKRWLMIVLVVTLVVYLVCKWRPHITKFNRGSIVFHQSTTFSGWWFQIFCMFTPTWGRFKITILTNIFQIGWNHSLVFVYITILDIRRLYPIKAKSPWKNRTHLHRLGFLLEDSTLPTVFRTDIGVS